MQYIYRILFVLITTFLVASGIYVLFSKGEFVYRNGYRKFNEMFVDKSNYDIVLFGSSRTHRNIDPVICDSVAKLSFYNSGISGAGFYEITTAFYAFFNVHSPSNKVIIWNVDDLTFSTDKKYFNPTSYFEFLDNPEIYAGFKEKEYPIWFYKHIPFTRMFEYNDDTRSNSFKGLSGFVNPDDVNSKGYSKLGYNSLKRLPNEPKVIAVRSKLEKDFTKDAKLDLLFKYCHKNKMKIIFIISPAYKNHFDNKFSNFDDKLVEFDNFVKKNNSELWRFDTISICSNPKYFKDEIHLNKPGTDIFSTILANKISEYLKQKK